MVNTDDFIKRLEIILDYYSLNASGFADKIGVQRSSISHLLSGRNKPSLDFILKILEVFPDVDLYWILNGKGSFPKSNEVVVEQKPSPASTISNAENEIGNLFTDNKKEMTVSLPENVDTGSSIPSPKNETNKIDKIVIFYTNGTFKSYVP
jgi:transcriptional regulator with XRE-family HTH domain